MYYFLADCENSISSPGQGEESSAECFSDIPASALSKLNHIAEKSYYSASGTESFQGSPFGTTSKLLTPILGAEGYKSFAEDFRAKTLVSEGLAQGSTAPVADYGPKWSGWFAKLNPNTFSWKTAQHSLFGGFIEFSEGWPRWGIMEDGECFHATMSAEFTYASGCGLKLPTLGKNEYKGSSKKRFIGSEDFRGAKMSEGLRICESDPIYLNPLFAELVMMWPAGWTDLAPLETGKFQEWLHLHGKFFDPIVSYDEVPKGEFEF